jgi:hypothetical protein
MKNIQHAQEEERELEELDRAGINFSALIFLSEINMGAK